MEIFNAIYERRSVRRFTERDIDEVTLKEIIKAATFAPSACNIQGWRFIIVKDKKLKEKLVDKGLIEFAKFAPVGILVVKEIRHHQSIDWWHARLRLGRISDPAFSNQCRC